MIYDIYPQAEQYNSFTIEHNNKTYTISGRFNRLFYRVVFGMVPHQKC